MTDRSAREAAVAARLDEIRIANPQRHTELMELLAQLVAESRARQAVR